MARIRAGSDGSREPVFDGAAGFRSRYALRAVHDDAEPAWVFAACVGSVERIAEAIDRTARGPTDHLAKFVIVVVTLVAARAFVGDVPLAPRTRVGHGLDP